MDWQKLQDNAIYRQPSIKDLRRKARKKAKKKARQQTEQVIAGYQEELIEKKTPAETCFINFLEKHKIKYDFQKIIRQRKKHYIVDFYLPDYHAVIEIDGEYHFNKEQRKKDKLRTRELVRSNIVARVIRLTNNETMGDNLYMIFIKRLCPFIELSSILYPESGIYRPGEADRLNEAENGTTPPLHIVG